MDVAIFIKLISLVALLALSAFFSGSETGLFSLSSVRIHRLQEEKKKGALLIADLLKEPRKVLATILLANLFVTVFSTTLAEEIASYYFGPRGLEICIVVMSLVILILCEIIPKVVAVSMAEKISLFVAKPLSWFMMVLAPARAVFLKIANILIKIILPGEAPKKEPISADHLATAIQMGRQGGILNLDESNMLTGILSLKNKTVKDFMTLREDVFAFDLMTPLPKIFEEIRKNKYSRIPIYQHHLDGVVGILYSKDLMMQEIVELAAIQIFDLLRPPFFVQESMRSDKLLKEFKTRRLHMAIALNAENKLTGIITLDDLMDAIVWETHELGYQPEREPLR